MASGFAAIAEGGPVAISAFYRNGDKICIL